MEKKSYVAISSCCLPNDTCENLSIADCQNQGGASYIDETCASMECPINLVCTGDLDGDGQIGFGDLLDLISAWGPCRGCPQDFDNNGEVEFNDLLFIVSNWGDCPSN